LDKFILEIEKKRRGRFLLGNSCKVTGNSKGLKPIRVLVQGFSVPCYLFPDFTDFTDFSVPCSLFPVWNDEGVDPYLFLLNID
jgi:hypothetical protein